MLQLLCLKISIKKTQAEQKVFNLLTLQDVKLLTDIGSCDQDSYVCYNLTFVATSVLSMLV